MTTMNDRESLMRLLAEIVTASEAAELAGIALETFTAYVYRGRAPEPIGRVGGSRVFSRAEVLAWIEARADSPKWQERQERLADLGRAGGVR